MSAQGHCTPARRDSATSPHGDSTDPGTLRPRQTHALHFPDLPQIPSHPRRDFAQTAGPRAAENELTGTGGKGRETLLYGSVYIIQYSAQPGNADGGDRAVEE